MSNSSGYEVSSLTVDQIVWNFGKYPADVVRAIIIGQYLQCMGRILDKINDTALVKYILQSVWALLKSFEVPDSEQQYNNWLRMMVTELQLLETHGARVLVNHDVDLSHYTLLWRVRFCLDSSSQMGRNAVEALRRAYHIPKPEFKE